MTEDFEPLDTTKENYCAECGYFLPPMRNPTFELDNGKEVCESCYKKGTTSNLIGNLLEKQEHWLRGFVNTLDPKLATNREVLENKISNIVEEWDEFNEEHEIHDWKAMKKMLVSQLVNGLRK